MLKMKDIKQILSIEMYHIIILWYFDTVYHIQYHFKVFCGRIMVQSWYYGNIVVF